MPAPVRDPETGKFVPAAEEAQLEEVQPGEETPGGESEQPEAGKPKGKKEEEPEDLSGIRAISAAALGIKEEDLGKPPEKTKKAKEKEKPKGKIPPKATPKATPAAAPPGPSAEDIGKAVAAAMKPAEQEKAKETPPDPDAGLPSAERRKYSIMREMAALWPDKYKNLEASYRAGQKKLVEYAQEWKKANPGKEFDDKDPEHEAFFEENDVQWDDGEFEDARDSLITKKAKEDAKKELAAANKPDPEIEALKTEKKLREHAPKIVAEQNASASLFWDKAGEEYKGFLNADGQVSAEKAKQLMEANPEATTVLVSVARALDNETEQLYKVMNGLAPFNKEDEVHIAIGRFAHTMEQGLLSKPEAERLDEKGRPFLPASEYFKLAPEKRDSYWTYSGRDIMAMRAAALLKHAKKIIADDEQRFKTRAARLKLTPPNNEKPNEETETEQEETPPEPQGKPKSPSSEPQTKLAASKDKGREAAKNPLEAFVGGYLS